REEAAAARAPIVGDSGRRRSRRVRTKDSNSASALWDSHWLKVIDIAAQSIARGTMEGQCRTMDLKGGRALSANRVDTAVVVAAVAAASIGALGLIGVLVQAWMGLTPSPFLTYLPMLLVPIAAVLACVAMSRAAYRRRQTEVGHSCSQCSCRPSRRAAVQARARHPPPTPGCSRSGHAPTTPSPPRAPVSDPSDPGTVLRSPTDFGHSGSGKPLIRALADSVQTDCGTGRSSHRPVSEQVGLGTIRSRHR